MLLRNILRAIIGFGISSLHVKIAPPPRPSDTDASPNLLGRSPGGPHRGRYSTFPPGAVAATAAGANATTFPQRVCVWKVLDRDLKLVNRV